MILIINRTDLTTAEKFMWVMYSKNIIQVCRKEASEIIETRKPLGKFICTEGDSFIGIDNSTGDAWTEKFIALELCLKWLNDEIEMSDLECEGED